MFAAQIASGMVSSTVIITKYGSSTCIETVLVTSFHFHAAFECQSGSVDRNRGTGLVGWISEGHNHLADENQSKLPLSMLSYYYCSHRLAFILQMRILLTQLKDLVNQLHLTTINQIIPCYVAFALLLYNPRRWNEAEEMLQ